MRNYTVDITRSGTTLKAWPNARKKDGTWTWCVQVNQGKWSQQIFFEAFEESWDAADKIIELAREWGMDNHLPVPNGLRLLHRLWDHLQSIERHK